MLNSNDMYPYGFRNSIQWVMGLESAKTYPMAPNTNAILMDSENDGLFYIKTCDNIGMCNLRTFKFEEIVDKPTSPPTNNSTDYVTREEFEQALKEMREYGKQTLSGTKSKSGAKYTDEQTNNS